MQSIFPSPSLISVATSPVNAISHSSFLSPTCSRSQSLEAPLGTDFESSQGPKTPPLTGPEDFLAVDKDIYVNNNNSGTSHSNVQVTVDGNGMVWQPYKGASSSEGHSITGEGSSPAITRYSLFSDSEVLNKSDTLNQKLVIDWLLVNLIDSLID